MSPKSLSARIALSAIMIYRNYLSQNMLHVCRFMPSCSVYAEDAIKKHGALRGMRLALWRIARCQPFSKAGADLI